MQTIKFDNEKVKVQVTTYPSGANIFVDEKFIGSSPLSIELEISGYELKIKKEGYKSMTQNISVGKNFSKNLNYILIKKE